MNSTHFLVQFRQLNKLYECMLKEICGRHKLTLIETTIISFLYNNPGRDTAADIVELRMLSKPDACFHLSRNAGQLPGLCL